MTLLSQATGPSLGVANLGPEWQQQSQTILQSALQTVMQGMAQMLTYVEQEQQEESVDLDNIFGSGLWSDEQWIEYYDSVNPQISPPSWEDIFGDTPVGEEVEEAKDEEDAPGLGETVTVGVDSEEEESDASTVMSKSSEEDITTSKKPPSV